VDSAVDVLTSAAWSSAAPAVSVVVATHDRARMLTGLLEALEHQVAPASGFEVVVVDDGSTDGTWDVLAATVARTTLPLLALRQPVAAGQGEARQRGLEIARGSVVAFTDDDCVPTASWVVALTRPLLRPAGPVVAQGRTVPWPEDADEGGPWARTVWVLRPTWLFETCNVAYRVEPLRRAGGFPRRGEAPVGPHGRLVGEDALTAWRLLDQPGTPPPVFVPGALVHHRHHPSSYRAFVTEQRGRGMFPAIVGRSPHGRLVLWQRWFLAPRTAALDVALAAGIAAAVGGRRRSGRRVPAVRAVRCRSPVSRATVVGLGAVPWLVLAWREAGDRSGAPRVVRLAQLLMADGVGLAAQIAGSVRSRTVVV
jgi:hypothetical protein